MISTDLVPAQYLDYMKSAFIITANYLQTFLSEVWHFSVAAASINTCNKHIL